MRKVLIVLLVISGSSIAQDIETLTIQNEWSKKIELKKSDWPIAFRCKYYGGPMAGQFMFSLRKNLSDPNSLENSWLIFPDHSAYIGALYRNGLDWRFDWKDSKNDGSFTVSIKHGGAGYYYDWSLAKEDDTMNVTRSATCE